MAYQRAYNKQDETFYNSMFYNYVDNKNKSSVDIIIDFIKKSRKKELIKFFIFLNDKSNPLYTNEVFRLLDEIRYFIIVKKEG